MLLHERQEPYGFIQVTTNCSGTISVYRNGEQKSFKGIPSHINLVEDALKNAVQLLHTATITDSVSGLTFKTDAHKLRGGMMLDGRAMPMQNATRSQMYQKMNSKDLKPLYKWLRRGALCAFGYYMLGPILTTVGIKGFKAAIIKAFVSGLITDWIVAQQDQAETKKEQLEAATNAIKTAIDQGHSTKAAESQLITALKSDKLSKANLEQGNNADKLFADLFQLNKDLLTQAGSNQKVDEYTEGYKLFLSYLKIANPDLNNISSIEFSKFYDCVTKLPGYTLKINKFPDAIRDHLSLLNRTQFASGCLSFATLLTTVAGGTLLYGKLTSIKDDIAQLKAEQNVHFEKLMQTVTQGFGDLTQRIIDGFENLERLRQLVTENFTEIRQQLDRIERYMQTAAMRQELHELKNYFHDFETGIPFVENYGPRQQRITAWANAKCYSPEITGFDLPDDQTVDAKLRVYEDPQRDLSECIGYFSRLFGYIGADEIPNISVLSQVIHLHIDMRQTYPQFDADLFTRQAGYIATLLNILKIATKAIWFIEYLQNSEALVNSLITAYKDAVTGILEHNRGRAIPELTTAHGKNLKISRHELIAYIHLAYNFSFNEDSYLRLLLSEVGASWLRIMTFNDVNSLITNAALPASTRLDRLSHLCADSLMNADVLTLMLRDYKNDIDEQGKQQYPTILMLAMIRLRKFMREKRHIVATPNDQDRIDTDPSIVMPNFEKLPLVKPPATYARDNLFQLIKMGATGLIRRFLGRDIAVLEQRNIIGETPLDYAKRLGDNAVIDLLRELGGIFTINYGRQPRITAWNDGNNKHWGILDIAALPDGRFITVSSDVRLWEPRGTNVPHLINSWPLSMLPPPHMSIDLLLVGYFLIVQIGQEIDNCVINLNTLEMKTLKNNQDILGRAVGYKDRYLICTNNYMIGHYVGQSKQPERLVVWDLLETKIILSQPLIADDHYITAICLLSNEYLFITTLHIHSPRIPKSTIWKINHDNSNNIESIELIKTLNWIKEVETSYKFTLNRVHFLSDNASIVPIANDNTGHIKFLTKDPCVTYHMEINDTNPENRTSIRKIDVPDKGTEPRFLLYDLDNTSFLTLSTDFASPSPYIIRLWDKTTFTIKRTYRGNPPSGLKYHYDLLPLQIIKLNDEYFMTCARDGIIIWDTNSSEKIHQFKHDRVYDSRGTKVAKLADGRIVIGSTDPDPRTKNNLFLYDFS